MIPFCFLIYILQQQFSPCDIVLDEDDEILMLVFEEALNAGDGILRIDFSGILNEHLRGFYRWYVLFFSLSCLG